LDKLRIGVIINGKIIGNRSSGCVVKNRIQKEFFVVETNDYVIAWLLEVMVAI
jgi:hypothetical protein